MYIYMFPMLCIYIYIIPLSRFRIPASEPVKGSVFFLVRGLAVVSCAACML